MSRLLRAKSAPSVKRAPVLPDQHQHLSSPLSRTLQLPETATGGEPVARHHGLDQSATVLDWGAASTSWANLLGPRRLPAQACTVLSADTDSSAEAREQATETIRPCSRAYPQASSCRSSCAQPS